MIEIQINGTKHNVKNQSLHDILSDLNYLQKWSAVEVNGEILQKDELKNRQAISGDAIEVITPVGGGSSTHFTFNVDNKN